jgi:uncharacterized protein YndB with AHSA1/START domain
VVTKSEIVEKEVRIAAQPETVFSYFTDAEKMQMWMGQQVTLDPRPGGTYRVDINGQNIAAGEFVEVVPHTRVVFTFGWEGDGAPIPPGSSTVEITLTPDGDGTLVRLRHSGLPSEMQEAHAEGWDNYMPRLALAAAGQDPGPDKNMG